MPKEHLLAFDLSFNEEVQHPLPNAFIVEKENNELGYVVKKANAQTLASYAIEMNKTSEELLSLCQELQPNALYKRYNAKNKKPKPLGVLLEDKLNKRLILQHIQFRLEKFIKGIISSTIPLSFHLDKSNPFGLHQVFLAETKLTPKLYFHKKEDHMEYRLHLYDGEKELIPCKEKISILLNQPPYVVYQQKVYALAHINANKLKPFLKKEVISIPNRSSVAYFAKFIKKVIKKAPIEAKGFDVLTYSNCTSCVLKPTTTIFSKVYHVELYFIYPNHSFSICDTAQKYVQFDHDEQGHFTVMETQRNAAQEKAFIQILEEFGLVFLDGKLASFKPNLDEIDNYYNLSKLIELKAKLKEKSIYIDLQLHRLNIKEDTSYIATQYQSKNDWFDIEMTVHTGEFSFPFTALVSHLKSGERLYELPDGSHFLIPFEWFSQYTSLINLGKVEQEHIRIQKNQFTLLEEASNEEAPQLNNSSVSYQPTGRLQADLRNYQKEGVNWLVKNYQSGLGSCLADDMGLGKTIQTLAYLDFVHACFESDFVSSEASAFPQDLFSSIEVQDKTLKALIVSPSSLTFNWENETQRFCPHFTTLSYVGNNRLQKQKQLSKTDVVFTSYGILLRDIEVLQDIAFHFIIIDESQQIKNRNSKIYKAINKIQAKHKVSLSGTPMENSLSDLWSQMQFINPNLLGNYPFFEKHFKKPIEKHQDEERIGELKTLIQPYLLRRTKAEVAKDLPELAEQVYFTKMDTAQAKLYETEKSKTRNYILEKKLSTVAGDKNDNKINILNALMRLRQLANHPQLIGEMMKSGKFQDVTAYLETLLKAKQKVLIFSSFTSHLQLYTDWCEAQDINYNLLIGKTSLTDRKKQVTDFENNDESLLFFISLKAGGTGLNLTRASYVVILDPWWNPFAELQAIGRAHRIGQTQKVNVVRFITKHTIEEKINALQKTKKELSENIIESQMKLAVFDNLEEMLA